MLSCQIENLLLHYAFGKPMCQPNAEGQSDPDAFEEEDLDEDEDEDEE